MYPDHLLSHPIIYPDPALGFPGPPLGPGVDPGTAAAAVAAAPCGPGLAFHGTAVKFQRSEL